MQSTVMAYLPKIHCARTTSICPAQWFMLVIGTFVACMLSTQQVWEAIPWLQLKRVLAANHTSLAPSAWHACVDTHQLLMQGSPLGSPVQYLLIKLVPKGVICSFLPGSHPMTVGKKQSKAPPAGAAQAVLQLLFLLVHRLEMAHALDTAPKITQYEKDNASWCVEQVNNTKACLSKHPPPALLFMTVRPTGNTLSLCKAFFQAGPPRKMLSLCKAFAGDSCLFKTLDELLP